MRGSETLQTENKPILVVLDALGGNLYSRETDGRGQDRENRYVKPGKGAECSINKTFS